MNVFERLTEENQAKVKETDKRYSSEYPDNELFETELSGYDYQFQVPIGAWFMLRDILGYESIDKTFLNAFKQ